MLTGNPQITYSELQIQVLSMTAGLHFLLILAFLFLHNGNIGTLILLNHACVWSYSYKKKERKYVADHFFSLSKGIFKKFSEHIIYHYTAQNQIKNYFLHSIFSVYVKGIYMKNVHAC